MYAVISYLAPATDVTKLEWLFSSLNVHAQLLLYSTSLVPSAFPIGICRVLLSSTIWSLDCNSHSTG